MNKCFVLLVGLALQCINAEAQIRVYEASNVPPGVVTQSGYQYVLPLTVITVDIPVTKIEWEPASSVCVDLTLLRKRLEELVPASAVSGHLNSLTGGNKVTTFKVGDIALTTYPVADQAKKFWVTGKKNVLKKQKLGLTLLADGRLSGGQTAFQDKTLEIVTGVAKVAGSLIGFIRAPGAPAPAPCQAKDEYETIKKAIMSLLTNNLGGESIVVQLPELRKIEASLLEELTFAETKTTYTIRRDVVIQPGDEGTNIALFTFSPIAGLIVDYPQTTYPGTKFYNAYADKNAGSVTGAADRIYYTLNVRIPAGQPVHNVVLPIDNLFTVPNGFRYNRPALTQVTLQKNGAPLLANNIFLPQLGRVGTLPSKLSEMQFSLDPETGSLLTVNQTMESISPEAISGLSDAVGTFKSLKTKELQNLTEEASKMEQRVKLLKSQKEYEVLLKAQTLPKE